MSVDKLVDSTQLDSDLTSVANAIRTKSGGSSQLAFPSGFVSEIGNIPSGGGGISWDDLLTVDNSGYLTYPTVLNLPNTITTIGRYAFYYRRGLTSISAPGVTKLWDGCFTQCTNLTSISFPSLTDLSSAYQPFDLCNNITDWDIPWHSITGLNNRVFRNCSVPSAVAFPSIIGKLGGECFRYSTSLQSADFGNGLTQVDGFSNTSLSTLVLRRTDGVVTLGNTNIFNNSPFASGQAGGTLYVPQSLISSYQTSSNWSAILGYANNSIQKIEGSYYETHYADGTLIPTE